MPCTTLGLIGRLELGELLETLIARAAALVGAPNGFVYLYDADSDDLEMRVGLGDNADDVGIRLGPGEGVAGLVWQTGQPIVVEDYSTWAGRSMDTRLAHAHSAMGIPLKSGAHAVGVIGLSHSDRSRRFEDDEIAVLSRFAELASIALDNAQLYSSLEQELAERQRAEERLQRYAAELEQSNEEVRRFAYIVSHDLRAPLVNLKGFSAELRLALGEIESAVSAVSDHLDEEQKQALTYALQEDAPEALGFIDTSVTHMDHFITALLKLSRLGRRELRLELVDVDGIVETCLQTLAHQIAESQTEVSVGELPEIVADQTSIEQIVGNILSNAIKYLHPDRPGKVEITAVRGEDETLFQIRDNGRGIDARNMDKVFAPFRRAGNEDVPGDGMGLAYVQALVRRHAGRIWCESEPGVGTLMSFTIPHHLGDDDYA
jgi:signal transduction histidine kinase